MLPTVVVAAAAAAVIVLTVAGQKIDVAVASRVFQFSFQFLSDPWSRLVAVAVVVAVVVSHSDSVGVRVDFVGMSYSVAAMAVMEFRPF